jgi:hypothetical protein
MTGPLPPSGAAALLSGGCLVQTPTSMGGDMRLVLAMLVIAYGTAVGAQVNDAEEEKREIVRHAISECLRIGLSPRDELWKQCLRSTASRRMDEQRNSSPSTSR